MAKIAFVGCSQSRIDAPYDDPSWEIWSQAAMVPKWDRWFEIHELDALGDHYESLRDFLFNQDGSKPIYMRSPHPRVKGSVAYPLEHMKKKYGRWGTEFLSSTCTFAIALAFEEMRARIEAGGNPKDETLGIWGVDMSDTGEYSDQKPGCRAFLMMVEQFGINVVVPPGCEMLSSGAVYALEDNVLANKINHQRSVLDARQVELAQQRKNIERQIADAQRNIEYIKSQEMFVEGAKGTLVHAERNWIK